MAKYIIEGESQRNGLIQSTYIFQRNS